MPSDTHQALPTSVPLPFAGVRTLALSTGIAAAVLALLALLPMAPATAQAPTPLPSTSPWWRDSRRSSPSPSRGIPR